MHSANDLRRQMRAFQQSLPMLLYRVLGQVLPRFRVIFSEFGLTEQQWRVLRVLWERDGVPLLALSEETLIPGPSLVGVVDRLERADLVSRRRSSRDRRRVRVVLTPGGRALQGQVTPRVDAAYQALEEILSQHEWRLLRECLGKIIDQSHSLDERVQSPTPKEGINEP